jgi:hypothetical protein
MGGGEGGGEEREARGLGEKVGIRREGGKKGGKKGGRGVGEGGREGGG